MDDTIEKEVMEVPELSNFDDISPEVLSQLFRHSRMCEFVALYNWKE
jgi:hypothetical protein